MFKNLRLTCYALISGLLVILGVLGVASVVFNVLTWVKLNDNKDETSPAPKIWSMGNSEDIPKLTNPSVLKNEEESTKPKTKPPKSAAPQQTARQSTVMKLRNIKNSLFTPVEPLISIVPPLRVNDSIYCPSYGEPDNRIAYKVRPYRFDFGF